MKIVAMMRELVAKGMSWEDAAEFGEKFEEGIADAIEALRPVQSAAARRQAAYRERQHNAKHNAERNGVDNAPLPLETKVSPTPLSKTQTLSPSKNPPYGGQKGSRLPDGWRPDEAGFAYAAETLGPDVDPEREVDRFLDYWRGVPGAKGRKLDWPATWRNWCRNAAERLPPPRKAHDRPHHDAKFAARQDNLARLERGADLAARLYRQP